MLSFQLVSEMSDYYIKNKKKLTKNQKKLSSLEHRIRLTTQSLIPLLRFRITIILPAGSPSQRRGQHLHQERTVLVQKQMAPVWPRETWFSTYPWAEETHLAEGCSRALNRLVKAPSRQRAAPLQCSWSPRVQTGAKLPKARFIAKIQCAFAWFILFSITFLLLFFFPDSSLWF